MRVSGRAALVAGVAALTGGALVFTPSVLPGSMRTIEVLPPVAYTANSAALPVTDDDVRAALELIGEVSAVPGIGKVTVRLGPDRGSDAVAAALPAANVAQDARRAPATAHTAAEPDESANDVAIDEPGVDVEDNAVSDVIDDVYAVTRYWANYVSLELGPWLINWIPFGYLVSDQIYIWYPEFVLPVVDSFVYDFLDPVVDNPLDLGVWVDGIGDIINTAVTGVYNGIVREIEYVLDFGWFPIPLPPLPELPLPLAGDSTDTTVALAASEAEQQASESTDIAEGAKTAEGDDDVAAESTDPTTEPADKSADDGETVHETADEETTEEIVDETEEPADEDAGESLDEIIDDAEEPADDAENDGTADEAESETETGDDEQSADTAEPDRESDSGAESDSDDGTSTSAN